MAYHYGLSIHSVGPCGPSGVSEQLGNDFIIALGCDFTTAESTGIYTEPTGTGHTATIGSSNEQAGTLMHELGHQFNLNHGGPKYIPITSTTIVGDSSINCKPNYASVMSYTRQYDTGFLQTQWALDYSRGYFTSPFVSPAGGAPPLIESALNEQLGLMTNAAPVTPIIGPALPYIIWANPPSTGTAPSPILSGPSNAFNAAASVASRTNLNWDGDTNNDESSVSKNINNFRIPGCDETTTAARTTAYKDYNDWGNLNFNFRGSTTGSSLDGTHGAPNRIQEITGATQQIIENAANAFDGFLSPINMDGSSSLKAGSATNPFKFQFFTGELIPVSVANLDAKLVMRGTSFDALCEAGNSLLVGRFTAGAVSEVPFVYSSGSQTYSANLQTKGYSVGVYAASIVINKDTVDEVVLADLDIVPPYVDGTGSFTVPICVTKK